MQGEQLFTYTRKQLGMALLGGAIWAVLGLGAILVGLVALSHGGSTFVYSKLVALGVVLLVPSGTMLARCTGRTVIDARGLRTRTLWKQRDCGWGDISGIDALRSGSEDRPLSIRSTSVHITRADGGRFTLPVPFTTARTKDPDFGAKLADIMRAWQSAGHR
jgi:hypothetical protein